MLKEIVISEFRVTKTIGGFAYEKTQAYTHAFCYTPDDAFVVKGMYDEVELYITTNHPKALVNFQLYGPANKLGDRNLWRLLYTKDGKTQSGYVYRGRAKKKPKPELDHHGRGSGFDFNLYEKGGRKKFIVSGTYMAQNIELRRLPKRWIPEFDALFPERKNRY